MGDTGPACAFGRQPCRQFLAPTRVEKLQRMFDAIEFDSIR